MSGDFKIHTFNNFPLYPFNITLSNVLYATAFLTDCVVVLTALLLIEVSLFLELESGKKVLLDKILNYPIYCSLICCYFPLAEIFNNFRYVKGFLCSIKNGKNGYSGRCNSQGMAFDNFFVVIHLKSICESFASVKRSLSHINRPLLAC